MTPTRQGYTCVVRVNNREYQTSKGYSSEATAKEAAAVVAFNICRSFSVNDGMYPNGFAHDNIVQGRAVPVGAGRSGRRMQTTAAAPDYRLRTESLSSGSRSGGSSPELSDDAGFGTYAGNPRQQVKYAPARHAPIGSSRNLPPRRS